MKAVPISMSIPSLVLASCAAVQSGGEAVDEPSSRDDAAPAEPDAESFWDQLWDDEDGMLDVSEIIAKGVGFLPIVTLVSEPAIGYGAGAGAIYVHPREKRVDADGDPIPPSISFAGGAATENGTWGAGAGHFGVWNEGRTRYLGALFHADARLSFYGIGDEIDAGIDWDVRATGTVQDVKHAVADHVFVGARYVFVDTESEFDLQGALPVDPDAVESRNSGLGPTLTWDDRDNTFTPNSGTFARASLLVYDDALGGDFDYEAFELRAHSFWELGEVVLGARLEADLAGSDAPFYGLPFLTMRGVPAFRYLGEATLVAELEPRWRISPRWGAVAFLAAGQAVLDVDDFGSGETVVAGGAGVRYLLARKLGLNVGVDVGVGPEESAVYFVFGSYWQGR